MWYVCRCVVLSITHVIPLSVPTCSGWEDCFTSLFSPVIDCVVGIYRTTFVFYNTYILLGTNPLVAMKSGIEPLYLVALTAWNHLLNIWFHRFSWYVFSFRFRISSRKSLRVSNRENINKIPICEVCCE